MPRSPRRILRPAAPGRPPGHAERPPDQDRAAARDIRAVFFVVTADPVALSGLADRAGAGSLRPLISQVFPLAEGRQAYESGQHSGPPGKTLLSVR